MKALSQALIKRWRNRIETQLIGGADPEVRPSLSGFPGEPTGSGPISESNGSGLAAYWTAEMKSSSKQCGQKKRTSDRPLCDRLIRGCHER